MAEGKNIIFFNFFFGELKIMSTFAIPNGNDGLKGA